MGTNLKHPTFGRRAIVSVAVAAPLLSLFSFGATPRANVLRSSNWLDWMTPRERDLFLNADPDDAPDLTASLQAALSSNTATIVSPGRGRARIGRLVLPEFSGGRTLDFSGVTCTQAAPLPGMGLSAGLVHQRFAGSPRFGGFDDLRIIGGHFVQTAEVHDAVFKLLYGRGVRVEGTRVTLRNGQWTPVRVSPSTDRLIGNHEFRNGEYITLFVNGPDAQLPIRQQPLRVRNADAGSFQIADLSGRPIGLEQTGRGSIAAACFGAWAFKIGGDDSLYTGLGVDGENPVVFQDGIHVVHGRRGRILGADVACGDDAFAVGQEVVHSDVSDRQIADWEIDGVGRSRMGHLARVYTTSAQQSVERITMRVRGEAGLLRNGVIGIEGFSPRVSTIRDITIEADAETGLPQHTGVNTAAVVVRNARNVTIAGEIRGRGSTKIRAGDLSATDASALRLAF